MKYLLFVIYEKCQAIRSSFVLSFTMSREHCWANHAVFNQARLSAGKNIKLIYLLYSSSTENDGCSFCIFFVISRETQTQVYCFFIWNKNVQMKRHGFWSLFSHCERKLWKENMLSSFCIISDSRKPLWHTTSHSILLHTYFIQHITYEIYNITKCG